MITGDWMSKKFKSSKKTSPLWPRFKTFCRIQWRMLEFYLAEVFVYFERPLKIIVNLVFLLTMPIWIGIIYLIGYVKKAWASKKNVERAVLLGRIWFWNSYKAW